MAQLTRRIRRFISWHRRWLAALAAAICIFALAQVIAPPTPSGVDVVLVTSAVAAGAVVTGEQVTVASVPAQYVPPTAITAVDDVVGQVAVAALDEGTMISEGLLLAQSAPPAGMLFVPVRLPDSGLAAVLTPGGRVTLVTVAGDGVSSVLAESLRVVALPATQESLVGGTTDGILVVLEVPIGLAPVVSTASLQRSLSVALG